MIAKMCPKCLNVYSTNLVSSISCPSYDCDGNLIVIDSDLYEILPDLLDLGFKIKIVQNEEKQNMYCLSLGDIFSFSANDSPSAFVVFENENVDELKSLHELCSSLTESFDSIFVSEINIDEKSISNFTIFCDKMDFIKSLNIDIENEINVLDIVHLYYNYKKNFSQYLYSLIEKISNCKDEKELEVLNE